MVTEEVTTEEDCPICGRPGAKVTRAYVAEEQVASAEVHVEVVAVECNGPHDEAQPT